VSIVLRSITPPNMIQKIFLITERKRRAAVNQRMPMESGSSG
jgi:hypothetical protein